MSFCKIPNSSTTATSYNHPNTIMLRDLDGASRVSSLIMRGSDFVKECVSSSLLTRGYIYFSNSRNKKYALLRNDDDDNLSLDFGQNNECGNFSIRTQQQTNFTVKNNRVGINQANPISTLDVSGTIIVSSLSQSGPIYATTAGQLQTVRPFHIVDTSANIPFITHSMFVLDISREIILPQNMYDGFTVSIINKCGESVDIVSSHPMFSAFYLPNGGTRFSLEPNRKIELTYTSSGSSCSWIFHTF